MSHTLDDKEEIKWQRRCKQLESLARRIKTDEELMYLRNACEKELVKRMKGTK